MGLFRRKAKEEAPAEVRAVPRDESNWHEWAAMAESCMAEADLTGAVDYWSEAICRFDESPKAYARLHDDISRLISEFLSVNAVAGKVIPSHVVAEMDVEAVAKHPDMYGSLFCDDLFYYVKENVARAAGPQEATMMFISAAYSVVGYLRYSPDIWECREKCLEVVRLGKNVEEQCLKYRPRHYDGPIKPKLGAQFTSTIYTFFEYLSEKLLVAYDGLGNEKYTLLTEYKRENMEDRLEHLNGALQLVIHSKGAGHISKGKAHDGIEAEVNAYIEQLLSRN